MKSAYSKASSASAVVSELVSGLGPGPFSALVYFAAPTQDGAAIGRALRERYDGAAVVGCTTAGELTESTHGTGGVAALGIGRDVAPRAAAALARFDRGTKPGIEAAAASIAERLGLDLRRADPKRYVGVVLAEGLGMQEEAANEALGDVAPFLSFVGGSAGDDGRFEETRVFVDGESSIDGAALLLLESAVPFVVAKTCSFRPTGTRFTVTRADVPTRTVYELDGRPVAEVYAEAVRRRPSELDASIFMENPVGLMVDGAPFVRSPQRLLPGGGMRFYCRIDEGTTVELMQSTDLVEDTHRLMQRVRAELGGSVRGGLAWNCILRRLELDAREQHGPFLAAFGGKPTAGFHTYGESWLGHMNQTLTGLFFG